MLKSVDVVEFSPFLFANDNTENLQIETFPCSKYVIIYKTQVTDQKKIAIKELRDEISVSKHGIPNNL